MFACRYAGFGKVGVFYDDNGISIDGHVEGWFSDDTPKRFEAYGWHVVRDVDGHDADAIKKAIQEARSVNDKPTLICCKTVIGYGAPNLCGSHDCHGAPLGDDEIQATRENLGWNHAPFEVPESIYAGWTAGDKGAAAEEGWNEKFAAYRQEFPDLAAELERRLQGELPADWAEKSAAYVAKVNADGATIASRKASQNAIEAYAPVLPEFVGGSADLAGSNLTLWSGSKGISNTVSDGNYIYYGVREFGMSAIMNGIALHGGFIPYGATFLMFMEYARNAVRMAALMKVPSIFVYTHDSIGLGEDGPTHQPVEQIASLRLTPNMSVWRPCDAVESAVAWKCAVERRDGPTSLIFSRQNLPHQSRSHAQIDAIARGGYVLADADGGKPVAVIIATGSEVGLAMEARQLLAAKGRQVRVVSMPSTDVFDAQDAAYRDSVLPQGCRRVSVEAGVTAGWHKYVGSDGRVIGVDRFGESAPAGQLFEYFGLIPEKIAEIVEEIL